MYTMAAKTLESEGQRVSILRKMQIFIEIMVERSQYARQAHPPRQLITYTRRARHLPNEAGLSQPVAR